MGLGGEKNATLILDSDIRNSPIYDIVVEMNSDGCRGEVVHVGAILCNGVFKNAEQGVVVLGGMLVLWVWGQGLVSRMVGRGG